ncbi:MAG: hypothetical protein ORN98_10090, partial [Alphaproteobacteria bacterium]|nr:hypothetical protein [Alphaproteobacteria bacterium]
TFMGGVLAGDPTRHVFAIRNCAKDTNYVVNFAQSCGADSDLKHSVAGVYRMMVAAGQGESFLPSLADFVAAEQGIDPSKLRADVKKD